MSAKPVKSTHPSFRRMVLLDESALATHQQSPPTIADIEHQLRTHSLPMRAMANHYAGMTRVLEPSALPNDDRYAIYASNLHRMRQINADVEAPPTAAVKPAPPHEVPLQHPADELPLKPVENPEPVRQPAPRESIPTAADTSFSDVVIPRNQKGKYKNMIDHLQASAPNAIQASERGELILDGKILRNTSYSDVIRNLYVDSNFLVPGTEEILHTLNRANLPVNMLGSKRAKRIFTSLQQQSRVVRIPSSEDAVGGADSAAQQSGEGFRKPEHRPPGKAPKVLRLYRY